MSNPLVSEHEFEKFYAGLPSLFKAIPCELSKEFDFGNDEKDREETQIDELIEA